MERRAVGETTHGALEKLSNAGEFQMYRLVDRVPPSQEDVSRVSIGRAECRAIFQSQ